MFMKMRFLPDFTLVRVVSSPNSGQSTNSKWMQFVENVKDQVNNAYSENINVEDQFLLVSTIKAFRVCECCNLSHGSKT